MDTKDRTSVDHVPCDLITVPNDLRRILKVQFKEFIHCIEDTEFEQGRKQGSEPCVIYLLRSVRSIKAA